MPTTSLSQRYTFMPYMYLVTFILMSILATDYIQKRRGEPGLKVKVTRWTGQ
jgi:hypothetical protein